MEHLKVRHILVVGHYNCGGVLAAMQNNSLGTLNSWVERIRDVYRLHQSELDGIKSKDDVRLSNLWVVAPCPPQPITALRRGGHADATRVGGCLQRARRLIELNIMEQCLNVYKTDTVQVCLLALPEGECGGREHGRERVSERVPHD